MIKNMLTEFKIEVADLSESQRNNLIVNLVRCGYSVYYNKDEQCVLFEGWIKEVVTNIDSMLEEN
jgi:hypothetical protein